MIVVVVILAHDLSIHSPLWLKGQSNRRLATLYHQGVQRMKAGPQHTLFSFSFSVQDLCPQDGATHSDDGLSELNLFWKHCHEHTQKRVSMVGLNPAKLTTKMSHRKRIESHAQVLGEVDLALAHMTGACLLTW